MQGRSRGTWLLAVAGLLALLPILSGGGYYTYLATQVLIYSMAAIGLNVLMGFAGQMSLAHAAFMGVGAYSAALVSLSLDKVPLWNTSGLHMPLGLGIGIVGAAVCGGVLALPALRVQGPYLAMMTIAFGWIVWRVLIEWVAVTGGDLGLSGIPRVRVGNYVLGSGGYYIFVLAFFAVVFEFQRRLASSWFGLLLRAVRHGDLVVASTGIPVRRVRIVAFIFSSAIAGLAGGLFAFHQSYINPDSFQIFDSIQILLSLMLGGAGTLVGPTLGSAILILLPEALQGVGDYRLIIYGVLMLVSLYWLPRGLIGAAGHRSYSVVELGANEQAASRESRGELPAIRGTTLEIDRVSKTFGGLVALRDVSLRVEPGAIHALIGPNGAGKTTLINVATGLYRADAGRILLDGRAVRIASLDDAARRGVVRTFQHVQTIGDLTTIEHVLVALTSQGASGWTPTILRLAQTRRPGSPEHEAASYLLNLCGIDHLRESVANSLSHGQRRLLELARALAVNPRVLLLDEPAAGLIVQEMLALATVLRRLKSIGLGILLVEHRIDFVSSVADSVTVLDHGEMIAAGAPNDVLRNQQVIESYLGAFNAADR